MFLLMRIRVLIDLMRAYPGKSENDEDVTALSLQEPAPKILVHNEDMTES